MIVCLSRFFLSSNSSLFFNQFSFSSTFSVCSSVSTLYEAVALNLSLEPQLFTVSEVESDKVLEEADVLVCEVSFAISFAHPLFLSSFSSS